MGFLTMRKQRSDVEAELDGLYGLPLEQFTNERNALATRLKKQGDPEAAARVRALSKPTLVAWTINQLARQERAQLKVLLSAADELRAAQEAALAGSEVSELRQAQEKARNTVQVLTRSARRILGEAGRATSDATMRGVSASLDAAVANPEARRLLEQGRLETEVESAGFAPLTGLQAGAPRQRTSRPKAGDELAERRHQKAAAGARAHDLRKELREVHQRARQAEAIAQKLEQEARAAKKRADRSRQEVDRVERALREAEAQT